MKKLLLISLLALISSCSKQEKIKNVIILIGDGMGPQQLGILSQYARQAPSSIYKNKKTGFEKVSQKGTFSLSLTYPGNGLVTDSAAAATQIASGEFAGTEMVGANLAGDPVETILKIAQKRGKRVGLVSDTKLTHATPAGFVAQSPHRSQEAFIAKQLALSDIDVMFSGGANYWLPKSVNDKKTQSFKKYSQMVGGVYKLKSRRKDDVDVIETALSRGYEIVFNAKQLSASNSNKVIGLFSNSYMPDAIAAKTYRKRGIPELLEMTKKAIQILEQSEKGFVLLVEAGQIDFAGHRNDIGLTLHEMIRFDGVVDYVYNWVRDRNDTVVVISADHETGSPGFSFSRNNLPKPKTLMGEVFKGSRYLPNYNFGNNSVLDQLYSQKMSYHRLFKKLDAIGLTPKNLIKLVEENMGYTLTVEEAEKILAKEVNNYFKEGHPKLGFKIFPRVDDYEEFYVDPSKIPAALLARAIGKYQNVVWATGTHTATPVPFIVLGPEKIQDKFKGILHTTIWGRRLIEVIKN